MGRLTIGCLSSLTGSMSLDFAVRLAEAAVDKGHEVDLWLSGNAVALSKRGQRRLKDYSFLGERLRAAMDRGLVVCACRACSETRGLQREDLLEHPRLRRNSMDWYLASCHRADRVLHIGGE